MTHTPPLPKLPEPDGFRTRYQSEPGMIGHYPWTYADQRRRRIDRPNCESEDLFTADKLRAYALEALSQRGEAVGEVDGFGAIWWKDRPLQGTKLFTAPQPAQPARVVGTVTGYQSANSLQQWQFSPSPDAAGLENQRFDVALSTPTAAPAPGHSPGNMAQPIHDPAVTTPREVLVGESPVDRIAAPAHREGYELAIQQAQPTPALKRHALEAADQLSKYAAAPFFPDTYKRGVTRSTTTEWWDGLAELIEEAQPLIVRALRECTEPHDKQQQAGSVMLTDAEKLLPHGYLFAKVAMVVPLLEEARDALTAITEHQRRLHGISPTLADRMDVAGTYSLEDWQEALASQPAQEQVCSSNTAESDQQVGFSSTGDEQQQAGAVVSDAPIVKVMRESPAHRPQLWLLTQAEDGTLKVLGSTNPVDMPSAWVHEYELALSQGGGK